MECACFTEYQGHREAVNCVGLLNDNIAVSSDSTVHLWRVDSGECVFRFQESSQLPPGVSIGAQSVTRPMAAIPGYTTFCSMQDSGKLIAGTADASIRMLDANAMRLLASWKCFSPRVVASTEALASAVSTVHVGHEKPGMGSRVGVGLVSGHISILEGRSGSLLSSWKAHDATVTKMFTYDDHYLLTCSLDRTMCLWDLRHGSGGLIRSWRGSKEGISTFSVYQGTAIAAAGSLVALCDMQQKRYQRCRIQCICRSVVCLAIAFTLLTYACVISGWDQVEEMKAIKLRTLTSGKRETAGVTTLSVLPLSHIVVAATDDGCIKLCR